MDSSANHPPPPHGTSPLTILLAPAHTLVDEVQGGSEYHWPYKLIERLALDHGVRVIALTAHLHVEHELPGVSFIVIGADRPLPVSNLDALRFHLRVYIEVSKILASEQPIDVIHHMLPFGFRATFNLLALRPRGNRPPLIIGPLQPPLSASGSDEIRIAQRDFSTSDAYPATNRRHAIPPLSFFIKTPALSALSRATLRRADALVAISERAARLYHSFSGTEKLIVIPVGVDTDEFYPASPRRESAGDGQPVTIVAVGYLMQRKAFEVMIRAMGNLVATNMPVHLRIVGEGPARGGLESLIRRLGLEQYITLVGRVPYKHMAHEYHQADIFCSMSRSESFGATCLEAMACGLPLVATPTGLFRDLLVHDSVGILVPFGDVDILATALVSLIQNRSLRETFGRRARELAVQEYDWGILAQRYLSLYQSVKTQSPHVASTNVPFTIFSRRRQRRRR